MDTALSIELANTSGHNKSDLTSYVGECGDELSQKLICFQEPNRCATPLEHGSTVHINSGDGGMITTLTVCTKGWEKYMSNTYEVTQHDNKLVRADDGMSLMELIIGYQ